MSAIPPTARTVIGPLTTVFTPLPSCFIPTTAAGAGYYGGYAAFAAQTCTSYSDPSVPGPLFDAPDCWPPSAQGSPSPSVPFKGWGFYSPGFACPAGYTSACSATGGGSSHWAVRYSMSAGEIAVGCCPSGYQCWASYGLQSCYKGVAQGEDFALATCSGGQIVDYATVSLPYTTTTPNATGSESTSEVFSYHLYNPMIELRWQSSDSTLPGFALATATGTSTSNSIASVSGTATATATSSPTGNTSSGFSTGAQAGIGVGVALGALLLLGAGILFGRRSRQRSKNTFDPGEPESKSAAETNVESPTVYPQSQGANLGEMDGSPRPPQEMNVPDSRHELPTSFHALPNKRRG